MELICPHVLYLAYQLMRILRVKEVECRFHTAFLIASLGAFTSNNRTPAAIGDVGILCGMCAAVNCAGCCLPPLSVLEG